MLTQYQQGKFANQLVNLKRKVEDQVPGPWEKARSRELPIWTPAFAVVEPVAKSEKVPNTILIDEHFWINFEEAQFQKGCIIFRKKFDKLSDSITLNISNDCILPEFENIKTWFVKRLGTNKFIVHAIIQSLADQITKAIATSPQIELITEELIDSVKHSRTVALMKEPKNNANEKALFTAEDVFSSLDKDGAEMNVFKQSADEIMAFLMSEKDVRNKRQLTYLAK